MASICKIVQSSLTRRKPLSFCKFFHNASPKSRPNRLASVVCAVGGTVVFYTAFKCRQTQSIHASQLKEEESKVVKLTSREKRFIRFASVEFDGQLYMTPQDFLESVVEAEPRPRLKRKILTAKELEKIKDSTPPLNQGSPRFFRTLRDKGIISYTEYLFLLSILTKPQSGFRIAFNMFDTDGNERVDKNEFLVMEKIFSHAWKGKRGIASEENEPILPIQEHYVDDEQGLQRRHTVDTTLIVHFFGPKGNNELNFENFKQFMLHLQTEVLELEFSEFSKGLPTISEVDFAKIMLRYTYLDTDEYDMYLDRLLDRIKETKGITFEEFNVFCQFLNNLEDFTIAMRMYTLADHPISKDEFHRAVKICTGTSLSPHLVHTVFAIFDVDGDGLLSYREFIAIMKDRLHRGFKSYTKNEGWEAFKSCIKQEMKNPT
ncbi:calcium uptake protein 3, mitochondrial isoform X2 [Tribolium castaneum]|uniref:Calcium uptake protein 1 homolog, mitochondrial-like Protein n=1 Tax=Tribolium castaneum TaxID=7070 RepID=D6W8C9_TRICA|nr:PREDICTED: calcium uptake protein 3, mitochondrial isoform X2 [Tribolium castaneum]EFA10933.2 Calcium uptake protein 1 homolog, mitochondrial-like Protein [Tribolium castaneum]|eukprot:XP_970272.2 PREDICTED: calcium uptake protein 3, mitochondrial isoform X2 [Tribolium castaneum]